MKNINFFKPYARNAKLKTKNWWVLFNIFLQTEFIQLSQFFWCISAKKCVRRFAFIESEF